MTKLPRQSDLFGAPTPPPARARRQAAAPTADAPARPILPAELAERATRPELDEFVSALDDAGLSHVALASVRALRRRRGGRLAERAARLLADELSQALDEEG